MVLETSDVYELLEENAFEVYTRDYGNIEVLDVDVIVDDVLPKLIELINDGLENDKIEIIS